MTRHTPQPLTNLRLSPTNEPLSQLVNQWKRGTLDPNPPYQRDDVWSRDQQVNFINSLLTGIPIPAIITNHRSRNLGTGRPVRIVVDGKQRITAARAWFNGELAVPASWFAPEDVVETVTMEPGSALAEEYGDTGEYVVFTGLVEGERNSIEFKFAIPVAEAHLPTVRAEAEVYLRVNGFGTPQTADDMANAARVAEGAES